MTLIRWAIAVLVSSICSMTHVCHTLPDTISVMKSRFGPSSWPPGLDPPLENCPFISCRSFRQLEAGLPRRSGWQSWEWPRARAPLPPSPHDAHKQPVNLVVLAILSLFGGHVYLRFDEDRNAKAAVVAEKLSWLDIVRQTSFHASEGLQQGLGLLSVINAGNLHYILCLLHRSSLDRRQIP